MSRKIINATLLLVFVVAATALTVAQTPSSGEAATAAFNTQLQFAGQEPYDANGSKGTRYKLSVTNRASHPDFLWHPTAKPCGKNENSSRTWVEVFGSPGDKRLGGFCGLRSSEDLGHLWFAVPSGVKGPQCVYIVMTDRQTGRKYISNPTCSRSFTVVRGLKGAGSPAAVVRHKREEWIEITSVSNQSAAEVQGGSGSDRIFNSSSGSTVRLPDSRAPQNKMARMAQSDLRIRQFLFPPTNDKALRVHVVNTGQGPSAACRLILTVRKINGTAVGRRTHVNVPALAAGASDWLHIDVKSILPNNVSLQSTTFKLNVDGTEIVAEPDEGNNEVWHNL
ncbi:MAG TPA: CARDB domain-containing protein [Pyrinomonadaceae bacterium]|nr:CARDB domain-containing protein [Pyrinomonadaceae bacterium]